MNDLALLRMYESTIRTWVYFIGLFDTEDEPRFIKIGYTGDIEKRFTTLQAYSPLELRILEKLPVYNINGVQSLESELHRDYKAYQVRGEWFDGKVWPLIQQRFWPERSNPWDDLLSLGKHG